MIRLTGLIVLLAGLGVQPAFAQHLPHHYPTVIGATGQPYGPTQAEYQYRLRYGHPSPGSRPGDMDYVNGYPGGGSVNVQSGGLGFGYGPTFGYPGGYGYGQGISTYGVYGPGYSPFGPSIYSGYQSSTTAVYGPGRTVGTYVPNSTGGYFYAAPGSYVPPPAPIQNGWNPPPIPRGGPDDPLNDPAFQGKIPAGAFAPVRAPDPIVDPSTPEQQARAIQRVDLGDRELRHIKFASAAAHYKNAIQAARDQAIPRFRLALAYVGMSRFQDAIEQYKLGLALDPTWPQRSERLVDLFGEDNTLSRNLVVHRVAEWVNEDIRDPERLFLLVIILHQNGDARAQTVLQTAIALGGEQPHLLAFLPEQVQTASGQPAQPQVPFGIPPDSAASGVQPPPIPMPPANQPTTTPIPVPKTDSVPPPPSFSPEPTGNGLSGPVLPSR